jgi:hypothetical protein
MKKLLLSLLFIAVISVPSFAQEENDQKFHFGLKASPLVAWTKIDAEGVTSDGIRIGFTYGLMTEFSISTNYAFATGVDISTRGGKYKYEIPDVPGFLEGGTVSVDQKIQFLDIPVALKLKTKEIGYIKYYGLFGFNPGIVIMASQDVESDAEIQPDRGDRSNQSDFTVFNIGLIVGAGLEYNLGGSTSLTGGIHFNNGLIDIWDQDKAKMKSNSLTLNVGIFF